jgi:hypothetical protein
MVIAWVISDLVSAGRAHWTHSWADIDGKLHLAPEFGAELDAAVDALIAVRPDGSRLRALVLGTAVSA